MKRVAESTPKIEVQDFDEIRKLYLASVDGHVAGHVVTTPKLDGVKITDLYVAPEARKQGIASSLIDEVKKRNSGKTLVLRARPYGVKGLKLEKLKEMYRKLGFKDESKAEDRLIMKVATDKSKRKFHSEHALGIGTAAALLSPLATLKPMNDLRNTRQMSVEGLARKARTGDVLVSHFKGPYSAWRVLAPAIGGSPYYHSEIVGANGFIHQPEGLSTVKKQLEDQHSAILLRPRNNITAAQRKRIAVAACLLSAEPYSGKKLLATAALRLISPAVGTKAFTNRVLDGNICTTGPASVLRRSHVDPKLDAPEGYELAPDYLRSKNFKPVGRYGASYNMGKWNRFYGPASRVAVAAAAGGGIYKATKDIRKHEGLAPLGAVVGGVGGLAAGAGLERIARVGVEGLQNMRGIGRFLPSSPARRAALSKFFNTISEKASLTPAAVMGLLGGVGGYLFAKGLYRGRDKRRQAKAKAKNQPVTKAAEAQLPYRDRAEFSAADPYQDYDKLYETFDKAHGPSHQQTVRERARMLAERHAPHMVDLADMAARLHDIGISKGREGHEQFGAEMVANDPRFSSLGKRKRLLLINAIRQHRASTGKPRSVLGRIVSDADRMAGTDTATALRRAYNYGKTYEPHLDEEGQHRRALAHLAKKFGPGGTGRRHYFPETDRVVAGIYDPIIEMNKRNDIEGVKKLLAENVPPSIPQDVALPKAADFAGELPDANRFGDVTKLPKAKALRFVIQKHLAERSGTHYDARIGNPELGLLSWATKKEWPGPGGKIMLFQQPVHPYAYGDFQGTLPRGYGKGEVRTHSKGDVTVTAAEPGKLSFTVTRSGVPEKYTMIRRSGAPKSPRTQREARTQGGSWLLVNHTPAEKLAMLEKGLKQGSLIGEVKRRVVHVD